MHRIQHLPSASNVVMEVDMYVVLGASGHTGHVVAQNLLARQQKVRVFGRNPAHLQDFASRGAEIFLGELTDAGALSKAFHQADAAYVLIPSNLAIDDPLGFMERVSDAIVAALRNTGIKHVVQLSGIGADKASGSPIVALHNFEQKLDQLENTNVFHLRAGYFMENTLPQANIIRSAGSAIGPVRGDLKLPMIASRDVGAAAADVLVRLGFHGKEVHELLGERDINYNEVTAIIGEAIGKPDLKYTQAPDDQIRPALVKMGLSETFAVLILETAAALNSGHVRALEPRTSSNTTATAYETFVSEEFMPAYQLRAAA